MNWIRARSGEQIEQRLNEILTATAALYETRAFESITLAEIARRADFTRSNLYRYFPTKEDIFLELLADDIAHWRTDIQAALAGETLSAQAFASAWVDILLQHRRMLKLFTILYTLLEPNASLDALIKFKQKIYADINQAAEFLVAQGYFYSNASAAEFLFAQTALAIGAYPMLELTPKQQQAMQHLGMSAPPNHFKSVLTNAIMRLLPDR